MKLGLVNPTFTRWTVQDVTPVDRVVKEKGREVMTEARRNSHLASSFEPSYNYRKHLSPLIVLRMEVCDVLGIKINDFLKAGTGTDMDTRGARAVYCYLARKLGYTWKEIYEPNRWDRKSVYNYLKFYESELRGSAWMRKHVVEIAKRFDEVRR